MYEPILNSVLVQIDDKDAQWGSGNDESMLGKSYSKGLMIEVAAMVQEQSHPFENRATAESTFDNIYKLKGRHILWNEGAEAGTTFEFDGKLFGLIYWWDVRGVKIESV